MNSSHALALSIVCVAAGVVLMLFTDRGDAAAMLLITSGAGGLGGVAIVAQGKAKAERARAEDAMGQTQILRKELARRERRPR